MRFIKEVLEGVMGKCDALEKENKEMKIKFQEYEHILEVNKELQNELGSMKQENDICKKKCGTYELQLKDLKEKVKDDSEKIEKACSETKLSEWIKVWKTKGRKKTSFAEVI